MTPEKWPSVHVVILHWKNYPNTSSCLHSLSRITYPNHTVLVVDNHSQDGSAERLQAEFPGCTFLFNPSNLGFSRGCNVAMREAYARGADYVFLLNNDTEVTPDLLQPAVAAAERDPDVGAVTGKILYMSPPDVIWQAGGYIHPVRVQGIPRGKLEKDRGQYDTICETGWASGAMSLFRRCVLERVGFLPEEYFFGQEEWDYSTAILRAGLKILYVPEFKAFHHAGGSYRGGHPVLNVYNGYRNKMIYAEKYMSRVWWRSWKLLLWLYLRFRWPQVARPGCPTEEDYRVRVRAGRMAFRDHRGIVRIELADLENVARRLGPTPTWGDTWRPQGDSD